MWPERRGRGNVVVHLPPAADQRMLALSGGSTEVWHGIATAENLSKRMAGLPILVGVVVESRDWH